MYMIYRIYPGGIVGDGRILWEVVRDCGRWWEVGLNRQLLTQCSCVISRL